MLPNSKVAHIFLYLQTDHKSRRPDNLSREHGCSYRPNGKEHFPLGRGASKRLCYHKKWKGLQIFLVLSVFVPECILCWILSYELFILKMPPLFGSFECWYFRRIDLLFHLWHSLAFTQPSWSFLMAGDALIVTPVIAIHSFLTFDQTTIGQKTICQK